MTLVVQAAQRLAQIAVHRLEDDVDGMARAAGPSVVLWLLTKVLRVGCQACDTAT